MVEVHFWVIKLMIELMVILISFMSIIKWGSCLCVNIYTIIRLPKENVSIYFIRM